MVPNPRSSAGQLTVLALLVMLLSTSFMPPAWAPASSVSRQTDMPPLSPFRVSVYFDPLDSRLEVAAREVVSPLVSHGIDAEAIAARSLLFIMYSLEREQPDAAVYIFQSGVKGIEIAGEASTWLDLARVVNEYSNIDHIFGIGNAEMVRAYVACPDKVHIEGSEVIDLRLTVLHALWTVVDILSESEIQSRSRQGQLLRQWVLDDFADDINEILSKGFFPDQYTGQRIPDPITDKRLTESWAAEVLQYDDQGSELQPVMRLGVPAQENEYIPLREICPTSSVGGPIGWVLDAILETLKTEGFQDLEMNVKAAEKINRYFKDLVNDTVYLVIDWFSDEGFEVTPGNFADALAQLHPRQMFELWSLIDQAVLDAWYEADDWVRGFCNQIVNTPVQFDLKGLVPVYLLRLGTPLNLGSDFASFGAVLRVKLLPTFEVDKAPFKAFMNDAVFGAIDIDELGRNTEALFTVVRRFIDIIPVLEIDLAICAFLPTSSDWVQALLDELEMDFFGSAHFEIAFPPIDASNTERAFTDVREWALMFEVDVSYAISLFDLFAPGAKGAIATILEYVEEILRCALTITVSVVFEISKKYQGQGLPALSTLLLDIVVGVELDIRLLIVVFKGTFRAGLRFEQKSGILAGSALALAQGVAPSALSDLATSTLGIYLLLYCSVYLAIDVWFASVGTHCGGPWTETVALSTSWGTHEYGEESADLTDTDTDGLPDEFEERMSDVYGVVFLNPNSPDTDWDGLGDKLELEIQTFPNNIDSDGDLLSDFAEHYTYLTDPLSEDTDRDNLTDHAECIRYHTNPFMVDSDGDGLHDWYEINHVYDVSHTRGSYGAVSGVIIGGTIYDDRTDPLNPDTDNDGIMDGQEWENGVEYANQSVVDTNKLVYLRWTHPLDSDSDDDSAIWMYDSEENTFYPSTTFLMDMNDGAEVRGRYVTFYDEEGYPVVELVKTNPVNPDTDNDTGAALRLNSDGLELSLDPPTDPTEGDTDHDGLLDGEEAIGPNGYGTNPNNPDTDNDNLPDYEDVMLPTDPRNPDTDEDGVLDGDEYYLYGTDPCLNDTDLDGLADGRELFFFYCSPTMRDSDTDGLTDGEEILVYLTDPLLQDTDQDGLRDGHEVSVTQTDPLVWDTDGDRLGDGDELKIYGSNPLSWDTDRDSLDYPNENGTMSLPLSDGDEALDWLTSPINADTDSDGLTDGQEIYLSLGSLARAPIPLNPLDNDTDHDNLTDGMEMILANISLVTYPHEGLTIVLRYHSCPVDNDTDDDGVSDWREVTNCTRPDYWDTDGDGLSDYLEFYVTGTSPLTNDTDGDEIPDNLESWTPETPLPIASLDDTRFAVSQWPLYPTSATDGDSDDDLLPDGLELMYHTDPMNPDDDGDGTLDGLEFDYDMDGLSDGEEFYTFKTWLVPLVIDDGRLVRNPGGFDNPDSDGDNVTDGQEVHVYATDPTDSDTDGDGVSDGAEIAIGGDPRVPITSGSPLGMLIAAAASAGFLAGILIAVSVMIVRGRSLSPGRGRPAKESKEAKRPPSASGRISEAAEGEAGSEKPSRKPKSGKERGEEDDPR